MTLADRGQRGGPGPLCPAQVGAEPRGRPAPARDAPQLRGAASFGENLRGLHRKETRPALKLLPRSEMGWKPPRPHSPPPPRPRRCLSLSFEAAQSFRVNEKSLRKGRGGVGSPPSPPRCPPCFVSPRCCCFFPLPARPRPDPPGPGRGGRRSREREGAAPGGTPALLLSLNSSWAQSAERMNIFTGVRH